MMYWTDYIKVALSLKLLGKGNTPEEVSIQVGTFHKSTSVFSFSDSAESFAHNRNQHVQEHNLSKKSCQDEVNINQDVGRMCSVVILSEITQT